MKQPRPSIVYPLVVIAPLLAVAPQPPPHPTQTSAPAAVADNVLLVTMDGMRWQEVFGGLTTDLLTKEAGGVADATVSERRFGAPTGAARRERLMPFFWSVIARRGQVFGDPASGSIARVTNGLRFSYPGYNELLAGFADPRIDSNDPTPNPNATVLEWLHRRPAFAGRVAAFASWELLPSILNAARSGIPCNGDGPPVAEPTTDRERLLNEFAADLPPYWGQTRFDAPTGFGALEYLRTRRPRILYVMLGETDEWAHGRRYDLYLDAAERNDRFIRRLWETAQAMPGYANRTALVVTTDHGRGETATDWSDHGRKVPAAERIWMAVIGPSVPALGVRSGVSVTQAQIAATIATLLGEDYRRDQPKAAPPLNLWP
jgi:Type I phosphodiesterase / nucleotide pyrophosphatase